MLGLFRRHVINRLRSATNTIKMQTPTKFETRLFIDGEYVHAKSGRKFPVINPATE